MLQFFQDILQHREFLREHVLQALRSKYRGSVLGFAWTLLNPLMICLAFAFIFAAVNNTNLEAFLPYFLAGYLPWTFFVTSATGATLSILGNASYVNRQYVPKGIFPLSLVLVNFVDLLAGLVSFFLVVTLVFPSRLHAAALFLPISLAILLVFVVGVAFLFATINVFFRDFNFLWGSISFVWFFVVPILFMPQNTPAALRGLNQFNVMYPMVRLFQDPLAFGVIPPLDIIGLAMAYAAILLVAGSAVFFRWQREFYMYV
ncbi:MAG: ABC transporter permease [Bryobacteraceae bacterium]|nr:ABC transporter permease [Bryobacteraceae bacterium]